MFLPGQFNKLWAESNFNLFSCWSLTELMIRSWINLIAYLFNHYIALIWVGQITRVFLRLRLFKCIPLTHFSPPAISWLCWLDGQNNLVINQYRIGIGPLCHHRVVGIISLVALRNHSYWVNWKTRVSPPMRLVLGIVGPLAHTKVWTGCPVHRWIVWLVGQIRHCFAREWLI